MLSIKASVLRGPKQLTLENISLEPPGSGEVQIQIRATGLCGSDLHYYQDFQNGDIKVQEQLTLGHESSGIVCAVGAEVEHLAIGDHVVLEVGIPCRHCQRCKDGRYNICQKLRFRSSAKTTPHFQGTLQEKINHPAVWCHKLPPTVHLTLGALIEPLSVAIHAFKRAQLTSFTKPSVLTFGAGPIGLLCSAVCKMHNAPRTKIVDIQADKVNFATKNGFASDGLVATSSDVASLDAKVEAARGLAQRACQVRTEAVFEGFDVVFECTGSEACLQAAIFAARPGGKVVLVGIGSPNQTVPISMAAQREVDIMGSFRYAGTYPIAIDMLAQAPRQLPVMHKLITHSFMGLDSVEQAFQVARRTHDQQGNLVLKTVVILEH